MRIFEINGGVYGSTGKIMFGIAAEAQKQSIEVRCASPITSTNKGRQFSEDYCKIGTYFSRRISVLLARITGFNGCFSFFETIAVLREIKNYSPNIIHLHNLHNSYINLPILFRYIKKHHIPVVWTLHDCWAFTGQCPYFTIVKCEKWKTGCHNCPSYREYPQSMVDRTKMMWKLKKKWFIGVENMTIVTPSQWLADLVKQSFLKDYPVKVIHNGIDLSVFKPTQSNFREKYNIPENKFILLGVAFGWGRRKGLDVFTKLSKRLDSNKYQIVLVGTDDSVDKSIPENIVSIHRTQNQTELAEIYTASDLFVNPTREENYPTVNMEAIACGTPVVTFRTGGSPEIIDEGTGLVVDCDDIDELVKAINHISTQTKFSQERCLRKAVEYDSKDRFAEYVEWFRTTSVNT